MEPAISISDIKSLIFRRAKIFILLFTLFMLGAAILAVALPPLYRSQAVILIEAQQIPGEYVKSTVTSYAQQRLETLTREILRFSALKQLIQKFELYPEDLEKRDFGSAVGKMREAITIEPISSKVGAASYTVAFILSYEGRDPQKTFAVTDHISNLYLKKETESREKQAAATTGFLESELANLKEQINEYEKKISAFKQQHIGELPGSATTNIGTLERLQREAEQITTRIRSLQDRKIYLNGQLASIEPLRPIQTDSGKLASNPQERLKSLRLELIRARSRLSDKHPDVKKLISEINELEGRVGQTDSAGTKVRQLRALRTRLKELKASKGDKHPDVIALSRQVDGLAKEIDALITDNAASNYSKQKPDNPAYINLMTQVVSADSEIKSLNEDLVRTRGLIADYQKKVENAPNVEREYNELTLDYQNAKTRYNDISGKLLQARVAQEMELQQHGEHFTITDHAYVPTHPSKPNRLAIMLLGFVLGAGAGLGGAAFREATDHTIKSSKDIVQFEGIDVLTAMPYTQTKEELRYRWRKRLVLATGCIGLLSITLVTVDKFIRPLSDVISIIVERLAF